MFQSKLIGAKVVLKDGSSGEIVSIKFIEENVDIYFVYTVLTLVDGSLHTFRKENFKVQTNWRGKIKYS